MCSNATKVLKRELRKKIRSTLCSVPTQQIKEESQKTIERLISQTSYQQAESIGIYSSMSNEFDTCTLLHHAFGCNKRVFLPRVTSKSKHEMIFLQVNSMNEVVCFDANSWGIREPPIEENRLQVIKDCKLDMMIVPGLAFDEEGRRCGQGMGFYDRFLTMYHEKFDKMPKLIGLALRVQIVEKVPTDANDWKVDTVLYAEQKQSGYGEEVGTVGDGE